jgi:hypothetical protein
MGNIFYNEKENKFCYKQSIETCVDDTSAN